MGSGFKSRGAHKQKKKTLRGVFFSLCAENEFNELAKEKDAQGRLFVVFAGIRTLVFLAEHGVDDQVQKQANYGDDSNGA